MPTPQELEKSLWKAIESDRTVMLELDEVADHSRPMTALIENGGGPIWFFTATDNSIVQHLKNGAAATATFASKGHDLFATIQGSLSHHMDRATIDRLWNPFIAAWYKGGKDDPKLALLRFDPNEAQVWENANSLFSGLKMLLGVDPKKSYEDKMATIHL